MGSLNEHVHNWLRRSALIDIESTKSVLKKGNALICSFSSSLFCDIRLCSSGISNR